jgi:hypothetical protein
VCETTETHKPLSTTIHDTSNGCTQNPISISAHERVSDDGASRCHRYQAYHQWHLHELPVLGPGPDARVQTQLQRTRPCACLTIVHPRYPAAGVMHKQVDGITRKHHTRRGLTHATAGVQHTTIAKRRREVPMDSPCEPEGQMSPAPADAADPGPGLFGGTVPALARA